jgi:hypothetical protein
MGSALVYITLRFDIRYSSIGSWETLRFDLLHYLYYASQAYLCLSEHLVGAHEVGNYKVLLVHLLDHLFPCYVAAWEDTSRLC